MIINGIELENINMLDADVADKYETEIKSVIKVTEDAKGLKSPGEMIRAQCNAIFDFFNSMFGEGTDKKIFGDRVNLKVCVKAFAEFNEYVANDIKETNEMVSKYSPNRASRRAK